MHFHEMEQPDKVCEVEYKAISYQPTDMSPRNKLSS